MSYLRNLSQSLRLVPKRHIIPVYHTRNIAGGAVVGAAAAVAGQKIVEKVAGRDDKVTDKAAEAAVSATAETLKTVVGVPEDEDRHHSKNRAQSDDTSEATEDLKKVVGIVEEKAGDYAKDAGEKLSNMATKAADIGSDYSSMAQGTIKDSLDTAKDYVNEAKFAAQHAGDIGSVLNNSTVKELGKTMMKGKARDVKEGMKNEADRAYNSARESVSETVESGRESAHNVMDEVKEKGREYVEKGWSAAEDTLEAGRETKERLKEYGREIQEDPMEMGREMKEKAKTFGQGLKERANRGINSEDGDLQGKDDLEMATKLPRRSTVTWDERSMNDIMDEAEDKVRNMEIFVNQGSNIRYA